MRIGKNWKCLDVRPGFLYNNMPKTGPVYPDSFDTIYNDIKTKIMPGVSIVFFGKFCDTCNTLFSKNKPFELVVHSAILFPTFICSLCSSVK